MMFIVGARTQLDNNRLLQYYTSGRADSRFNDVEIRIRTYHNAWYKCTYYLETLAGQREVPAARVRNIVVEKPR